MRAGRSGTTEGTGRTQAAQRSDSQLPTVNMKGSATNGIVCPSSHTIPTIVISGPRRLSRRRAQMKTPQATNDQPTSASSTVTGSSGPC